MKRTLILAFAWALSACASVNFSLLQVNSLASETPGVAAFDGLEAMADRTPSADKRRVNIIFLHGIGWVENPNEKPLANAFITGVADAYGLNVEKKAVSALCGRDLQDEDLSRRNHVYIKSPEIKRYRTAIPGRQLQLDRLVCMDRQVLPVRDDLDYVIYRIFWDEAMWESLQNAHVGQDDSQGDSLEFAGTRRSLNRNLKDKFVNYGFSDAIMYLGPAGQEIRNAIRGAMCAAALEANGLTFENIGHDVDYQEICAAAERMQMNSDPFAFVAESLGSKIALDVVRDAMTDGRETVHDVMIRQTQVFMLANQIPLLSLSDLSDKKSFRPSDYAPEDYPTLIAFSEINDFLTYELVPFYEQLYKNSQIDPAFGKADPDLGTLDRHELVNRLGFNAIDMRVEFAKPIIPFVNSFVDPAFAHNGHVRQPEIMDLILCGADGADARLETCDVNRSSTP
ncbi:MAG: hypothetical protein ACSHX3_06065 [Litorimonas sp.]